MKRILKLGLVVGLLFCTGRVGAEEGMTEITPALSNTTAASSATVSGLESPELLLFMPVVVTAAKKAQTIAEAPAVMTVISAEDIQRMGARTLMDVLKTVPGFTVIQDSNEHIVALRGIFASTNQKFLVMRDGHRLNDWMWNSIEHDYSLTLANVKRIEVLRGPGASLYGSAALCGVVNIITKDAEDVDGTAVKLGYGMPQQFKADAVFGKKYKDTESLLAWGSVYRTEGEKVDLPAGKDSATRPIDGYMLVDKRGPSFDTGLKLKEGKFVFDADFRNSNYIQPGGNAGQLYDRAMSDPVDFQQTFRYGDLNLTWEDTVAEHVTLKLNQYYNYLYWSSWQRPAVARDAAPNGQMFFWEVEGQDYGVNYSGSYELEEGSVLVGVQAEQRDLLRTTASVNYQNAAGTLLPPGYPNNTNPVYLLDAPVRPGGEYYLAAYAQVDYKFFDQVMINLGVRDDYYKEVGGSINPRASVIYNPSFFKPMFWKTIYGRSFLNPSYFYRFNSGKLGYYGGPDLKPEVMDSYQTQFSYYFGKASSASVTGFYNIIKDVINQKTGFAAYTNFGQVAMEGVEGEVKADILETLGVFANYTWQKPDMGNTDLPADPRSSYQLVNNTIKNIPTHMANAGVNYAPIKYLNLNLTANWTGPIESPTKASMTDFGPTYQLPGVTILNLTVIAQEFFNTMDLTINVNNLLNTEYYMGGTVTPFRQPGRWILATLGYKF